MATSIQSTPSDPTPSTPTPRGLTNGPSLYSKNNAPERLGMRFDQRLLLATFTSSLCGFILGSSHAGRLASLRFRAENAHRLPISQPGWYLYHKSKNYYKMKHGITTGIRRGAHLAVWTSIFFIIEESIDVFRGTWRAGRTLEEMEGIDELDMRDMTKSVGLQRDFWSSGMAGMVTGGIWSAWNAFPMVMAARTIRMGAVVGLAYGLSQDGLRWAQERYGDKEGESWIYKDAKNRRNQADTQSEVQE